MFEQKKKIFDNEQNMPRGLPAITTIHTALSKTQNLWTRPTASTLRSGFEVTAYQMVDNVQNRSLWTRPTASTLRSGFEVTAYQMVDNVQNRSLWTRPTASTLRSGFEVTAYQMVDKVPEK